MFKPEEYLRPEVVRQVQRLDLQAKFIAQGFLAGLHDSPYRGFSMEFSEHRRYSAGDDPKTIDWNVWAKSDRIYCKTFHAETSLAAYLVVDTSRSMAFAAREGDMTKLEYATVLAAALGYLMTRQQDALGLCLVGTGLNRFVKPRASRRHLVRLLTELARARGEGKTALAPSLVAVARRVKRKSLMLILSDLVDDPEPVWAAIKHLLIAGHDVVVFHILDAAERRLNFSGPVILEDPETGQTVSTDADHIRADYTRRIEEFIRDHELNIRKIGGDFVSMTTDMPFDKALSKFLTERKRQF